MLEAARGRVNEIRAGTYVLGDRQQWALGVVPPEGVAVFVAATVVSEASGKVVLSAVAEREVLRIVRRGLVSYTERTVTELEPLLEELARVRRRGYATALGEFEMGLNAVAAPVHDARGNVIAAVDIWGPAFRLTPRRIPELAAQAREAAASISVRLGGTGTATAAQPTLAQALSHTAIGTESAVAPDAGLVTELPDGVAAAS